MLGAAREVHGRINGTIGPELGALLDLMEEGSDLHGRLTQVVSRLNDEVDALGATVGYDDPSGGPRVYRMDRRDDDESSGSESDAMSADSVTVEEDELGPAQLSPPPRPQPVTPVVAPAPESAVAMADSSKREAPSTGSGPHWANTGAEPHGPRAWCRGAQRPNDEETIPPRSRRRTAAEEDAAATMEGAV